MNGGIHHGFSRTERYLGGDGAELNGAHDTTEASEERGAIVRHVGLV
jgi:hypothetical protein